MFAAAHEEGAQPWAIGDTTYSVEGQWKITYEGICTRREHGRRLDVPSILSMSLAPVGILIQVIFLVLVTFCVTIAVSNAPPDTVELGLQSSLTDFRWVPNIRTLNARHISLGDFVCGTHPSCGGMSTLGRYRVRTTVMCVSSA